MSAVTSTNASITRLGIGDCCPPTVGDCPPPNIDYCFPPGTCSHLCTFTIKDPKDPKDRAVIKMLEADDINTILCNVPGEKVTSDYTSDHFSCLNKSRNASCNSDFSTEGKVTKTFEQILDHLKPKRQSPARK